MKSKLLMMAAFCLVGLAASAQTKGTNTVSLGFGLSKNESKTDNGNGSSSESTNKNNSITLGYGLFFKDNEKLALDVSYGQYKEEFIDFKRTIKNYGAVASYQKYFPLVKKFYAYGGGKLGYTYGKQIEGSTNYNGYLSNVYSAGAYAGISWFLSKRFALETTILSANMGYHKDKYTTKSPQNLTVENESSSFGINSQGTFNNLGFKIYILF